MVNVFSNDFFLHYFSCKVIEENLGQVKGSSLHQMVQNELVAIGPKVFKALFMDDSHVDNLLENLRLA